MPEAMSISQAGLGGKSVGWQFSQQGVRVLRFRKPTHTKPAPEAIIQEIVEQCDVVVEGLAD